MKRSHDVDYLIYGDDLQFVEVELDPQETVIAEAGAMMFMEDGIDFVTKMGDGSNPNQGFMNKLVSVGKRALTGESLFMTHFTNQGKTTSKVAFGAPYPGKIIAIDLDETDGELICQRDSFLAAALGTELSIAFTETPGRRSVRRRRLHSAASAWGRQRLHPRRRHHRRKAAQRWAPARRYGLYCRL